MSFLDAIFKRNSELGFMFDVELIPDIPKRIYMKKLAVEICASFLARTISQSEFRVKNGKKFEKNELYYRLNVRPNKNMTSSTFWDTVVTKLIYDNECLIIQSDDEDLLIADSFEHREYAVLEDIFTNVVVKGYEFKDSFLQSKVLHLRYRNERLAPLIDGMFDDYGELFGRVLAAQKRKNQIRGTVDMDMIAAKSPQQQAKLQEFIDNMYKAFGSKDIAIVPQQPGIKYNEVSANGAQGQSVDEINKLTGGFLNQVAIALGIPPSLINGDLADVEKHTKNYTIFSVSPLLKKICDEANNKFFTKEDYFAGKKIEAKSISYNNLFDIATSIDKLISSGAFKPNEIRQEAGHDASDDPRLDKYYITKNYTSLDSLEGGEND